VNLTELLDELRSNILYDRSDRVAGGDPYLWSDATLVRYINEAQRRFARRALVIRDNSSAVTTVTLVEGQGEYVLDPSVLAVLSAKLTGDNADLARAGHSAFDTYVVPDTYFFDPAQLTTLAPGKPLAFSTDETLAEDDSGSVSVVSLRVYPTPSADYDGETIRLRLIRLPIDKLVPTGLSAVPEIPEDYHLAMLDWAAYLALRIVDTDAGNAKRADEFRMSFEAHVMDAKREMMRKIFAPTQWGFGRNGFSWER